jgi:hypothetical protein
MEAIKNLTTQPPVASEPPTASIADRLTEQHIALLWERMTMIYGHKWTSNFGDKDDGTWLGGLCDVTPEQVVTGLEKCRTNADPWPPTLPEFRAMCRPNTPAYHLPFKKLQKPETNPEIIERELSRMKQILRSRKNDDPITDAEALAEREAIMSEGNP